MELIIGSHVSFKSNNQLLGSVQEALSYGANTFMFYTGAPQNTKRGAINDGYTLEGLKLMKENNIKLENIVVHAPYIVNLCNPKNYDFSVGFLINELERCQSIGIKNVVLHPGSALDLPRGEAIQNIIQGLNQVLSIPDNDVCICLETMAGKGSEVGVSTAEIKAIIDGIKYFDRIGVCLDTCHLNDAGYDISNFDAYLDEFDKEIGLDKIKVVHVNDSKNAKSSHKDRHENIGLGTIGFDNLINVIYNKRLENIPKILETPYLTMTDDSKEKIYPPYKQEIDMIRKKEFNPNLIEDIRSYYK